MDSGKRKNSGEIMVHSKRIQLDQTTDSNLGTAESTKSECSFHDLPLEIIGTIFSYTPGRCWPRLEMVNHYFQSGVLEAYKKLKIVRLGRFYDKAVNGKKDASERREILHSILRILYTRSPNVVSIVEFSAIVSNVEYSAFQTSAKFTSLKCVDFSRCRVDVRFLAIFLASSGNRARLEELRLVDSIRFMDGETCSSEMRENDSMLLDAVMDKPGRPPLRLKTFIYENNNGCLGAFFAGLDSSSLERFSVAENLIDGHRLAEFLGRCTKLQEFRLGATCYDDSEILQYLSDDTQPNLSFKTAILDSLGSFAFINLRKLELFGSFPDPDGTIAESLERFASNCQRLDTLDVRHYLEERPVGLLNVIRDHFSSLDSLYLNIFNCDAAALTQLVTKMRGPKSIGLCCRRFASPRCPQINLDVLKAIVLHARTLNTLCLEGLDVSDETFQVISELEQLKELSVTGPGVTDRAVIGWCQSLGSRLELLELSGPKITDSSIVTCAGYLERIRHLSLRGCRITDHGLHALVYCRQLETLDLIKCMNITPSGVQTLIDRCTTLVHLKVPRGVIFRKDLMYHKRTNSLTVVPF